jgi:Na+/H+ antiporter NhaD/arsenite permease-like protein
MLVGRVQVSSFINRFDGDDSLLRPWQKVLLLFIGIAGLWSIPTFHNVTKLPPFLGALCVLALIWLLESAFTFKRNGNRLFIQHKYIRNTEFIGMRLILYFLGVSLMIGALVECGALKFVGELMATHLHNVYIYGGVIGIISSLIDNIPFVMVGLHLFEQDLPASASEFVQNGTYWQLLSFCSALGGSLLYVGTLAGHAVVEVSKISFTWYVRNIFWRVLIAWLVGMAVFYATH